MKKTKTKLYRLYFDKKMTMGQIGKIYNISHSAVAKQMDKLGLKRRSKSEATYASYNKKECFHMEADGNRLLANLGPILYWCEGTSRNNGAQRSKTLAFTNTNVNMLKIWLKYLHDICNLDRKKIKARLYIHKNQNAQELKNYWSKTLKIPASNFENVSYTKKISTRPEYKGTVKIKVHNVKLIDLIKAKIAATVDKLLTS